MKVFAYREVIKKKHFSDTDALIAVWKASWSKHGWEPVVLGIEDAKKHPFYKRLNPLYEALPSANNAQYEAACFRRWLAMAQSGEELMVDYDVINYGFTPDDFKKIEPPTNNPLQLVTLSGWSCPCAVYSTNFMIAALLFATWKPSFLDKLRNKSHVSDQSVLQNVQEQFKILRLCCGPDDKHIKDFSLVHYANASMGDRQPRSEWIPKLRPI